MTAFVLRNHAIETAGIWLPTHADANGAIVGPPVQLVRAWVVVEEIMALVPQHLADEETDAQIQTACDTLNAIAEGMKDVHESIHLLEATKFALQRKFVSSKRTDAVRLGFLEATITGGLSVVIFVAFHVLRYLDWAGGNVIWTDVENAISATGFGLAAFAFAVLLRRTYASREDKIEEISEYLAKGWKPWELAAINFLLVVVAICSIFFGIKLIANFHGFGLIATPWKALLPGFLLGLAAPKILRGLLGR